jgi:DNA-binding NtrC family response regulator
MYVLAGYAQHRNSCTSPKVLILDPDDASHDTVVRILSGAGYQTERCVTRQAAFDVLGQARHAVLVAPRQESLLEGLSLAGQVQKVHPGVSVILLTGDQTLDVAVAALQAGVFDFMTKSFEPALLPEHLLDALRRTIESERSTASSAPPSASTPLRDPVREVLVGRSPLIEQAREAVRAALNDSAPVLIHGETGTEKLSVARLLHDASGRRARPFVVVSSGPSDSAVRAAIDHVPGTLFFADVAALDAGWQADLAERLSAFGASQEEAPARIVAGLIQFPTSGWDGGLLSRLFDSVGTRHVVLPPLPERGRDVGILAEHFAERVRLARGDAFLRITHSAMEALIRYAWPGNVEELRFAIQHAASLCADSTIRVADLPPSIGFGLTGTSDGSGAPLQVQSLEDMELSYIQRVLDAVGGNKASAARLLGVDRTTLYRKLHRQEQGAAASSEPPLPVHRLRK